MECYDGAVQGDCPSMFFEKAEGFRIGEGVNLKEEY